MDGGLHSAINPGLMACLSYRTGSSRSCGVCGRVGVGACRWRGALERVGWGRSQAAHSSRQESGFPVGRIP